MDLRKLQIFVAVAQAMSFSRAAEMLPMAQPAVSIAIRKLEEELDCLLFERQHRRVRLTSEGERLFEKASLILDQVADLEQSVRAMQNLLAGELSIACPSMLATYYLPGLLGDFLALHPGLKASVTQMGTARIEAMLLGDEIEIGVITADRAAPHPELEMQTLVKEKLVVCVAAEHPWARRREIAISALHNAPMVVYENSYFIREKLDQLCAEQSVQPDFRMQTNFLPLIVKMVRQGMGATVGLQMMASEEQGIVCLPLKPRVHLTLALAKRRGRRISRANQAFVDWLGMGTK